MLYFTQRPARRIAALLILAALSIVAGACGGATEPGVHVLVVDGSVNPVLQRYIERGVEDAEAAKAPLLIIQLDTPGGLDSSMRKIIQRINESTVPVAVFVSPPGARAGSAGTFITVAAHVAVMAPGTNIGAAHPVDAGGGDIEGTLGDKVTNDAAAFIRSLAELRGRNADWAESTVRESKSYTAEEALAQHGIDMLADDLETLADRLDGRTVELTTGPATIQVSGQPLVFNRMTLIERFLYAIVDPNIAFLLLSLGGLAIFIEILHPGAVFPGAFGVLAVIVALFGLGNLDVNFAGVALILLAFLAFFLEVFVPSFGLLTVAGIISLIVGGSILTSGTGGGPTVSRALVIATGVAVGVLFSAVAMFILQARGKGTRVGAEILIGKKAVARTRLDPSGFVFIQGERWRAVSQDGVIEVGEPVVIQRLEGLSLHVRRVEPPKEALATQS